ncbi:MAG: porin family protein [Alphaproteobacteria bacterium]|nr:porin family protein [Alphaproteobacteria bacterium]
MSRYKYKLSNNRKKIAFISKNIFLAIFLLLPVTKAFAAEQYFSLSRNFLNVNFQGNSTQFENYLRYTYATAGAGYSAIYGYNLENVTKGFGMEAGYQLNETEKRTRTFASGGTSPFTFLGDDSFVGTSQIKYSRLYVDARYYYSIFQRTATPAALYVGVGISQTKGNILFNGTTLHSETYTSLGNFVLGVRVKFTENAFLFIDYQSLFPYLIAKDFAIAGGQKFTVEAASNTIGVAILFGSKK